MNEIEALAHIIQGEAGICGFWAMVAVAWVHSRNDVFYGWQEPAETALWIAEYWSILPDPTHGAKYLVNNKDLKRADVRSFTIDRGPPSATFTCKHGYRLFAFRGR